MVVVNLYRFEDVAAKADARLEELFENIDIGGPTLIRAAAKNYQDVAVVVSPADYGVVIEEMRKDGLSLETAGASAKKALPHHRGLRCRHRRASGKGWIPPASLPPDLSLRAPKLMDLALWRESRTRRRRSTGQRGQGIAGASSCMGKELSYNNLVDLDAAVATGGGVFRSRTRPLSNTPILAGARSGARWREAYRKAFECDPLSAYGGVSRVQPRRG